MRRTRAQHVGTVSDDAPPVEHAAARRVSLSYADSFLRPCERRFAITRRPPDVAMRLRKP